MRNLIRKWYRILQNRPTLITLLLIATALAGALMIGLSATAGEVIPTLIPTITTTPALDPTPSIRLSSEQAEPGALIFVAGDGWRPGDTVSVYVEVTSEAQESLHPLADATVAEDGSFVTSFTFPEDTPWARVPLVLVIARSSETDDNASTTLEITSAPLTATPSPTSISAPTFTSTPTALPRTDTPVPPSSTPTNTPTATQTPTPTSTPTNTPTAVPTSTPTSTRTPMISEWRGEYFSSANLTGSPALVRNDTALDFDWGRNAPAVGLPADQFSVRWTRTLAFESGQYRFHAVVDDGVRLWVDDHLIIDAWQKGAVREVTADHTISTGNHDLRVEYYELGGQALVRVWWEKMAHYPNWKGEYWSNRTLSGHPDLVRNDVAISYDWGWGPPATGLPVDDFSIRWTRTANFDAAAYRFHIVVDDGARFWIDDQLIVDSWHDGEARELTADHSLSQGTHSLRVEFYEQAGMASIQVWWERVLNPSYPDWKGQYWSNRSLNGNPTLVRNDEDIDFSWSTGAAAVGLPADGFSARWSRRISFRSGLYRFYARASDGIRLYVDGDLALDEWHPSTGDEVYAADVPLHGEHKLIVEYYERGGEALVRLEWHWVEDWPTPTPTKPPTSTPTPTSTLPPTPEPTATPTSEPKPTATPTPTATSPPTPEPTATQTIAPTLKPTAPPLRTPEPVRIGIRLNEVLPVPATVDWDGNGVADDRDEWIEIHNAAPVRIDLSGWTLDSGPSGMSYVFPQGTVLEPDSFMVSYRQETGIILGDGGGEVRLLGPARPTRNAVPSVEMPPVEDHYGSPVVNRVTYGALPADASYSRGEGRAWHAGWSPSPGKPNLPPEGPEASTRWEPSLWELDGRPRGLIE